MIQLIDVPKDVTLEEKICGLNRAFFAPEVIEGGTAEQPVTVKADVWSIGALLYLMLSGSVMQRISEKKASQKSKIVFDFSEHHWGL